MSLSASIIIWMFDSCETETQIACAVHFVANIYRWEKGHVYRRTEDGRQSMRNRVELVNSRGWWKPRHKGSRNTMSFTREHRSKRPSGQSKDIETRVTKRNTGILLPGSMRARLLLNIFCNLPPSSPFILKCHLALALSPLFFINPLLTALRRAFICNYFILLSWTLIIHNFAF